MSDYILYIIFIINVSGESHMFFCQKMKIKSLVIFRYAFSSTHNDNRENAQINMILMILYGHPYGCARRIHNNKE